MESSMVNYWGFCDDDAASPDQIKSIDLSLCVQKVDLGGSESEHLLHGLDKLGVANLSILVFIGRIHDLLPHLLILFTGLSSSKDLLEFVHGDLSIAVAVKYFKGRTQVVL